MKCIDRASLAIDGEAFFRLEVNTMRSLNHKNIIKFIDAFEDKKFFYIVQEYLAGGQLFDRLVKQTYYNESCARDIIHQIVSGIKFCHDSDILHRCLKPENIWFVSMEDESHVKITDFEYAVQHSNPNPNFLKTRHAGPTYSAPEALFKSKYEKPVDMWSVGIIAYVLLAGYPPFHDDNQRLLYKKIKKGEYFFHEEYWKNVSEESKDFISKLIVIDPTQR